MSDTIIKVENLSKLYRLGEIGTGTISHDLNRWWARIRGKEDPFSKIGHTNDRTAKAEKNEFIWALEDINFEIKQGEILGIIGKNGAGKSTLLKILSQVTTPTTGKVKVKGRIASLLEVGTGFHPEMTGRENIFLNGAIMGMTKSEIRGKFDEIIEFAGVAKYIDTPVKRYSSGMYVRLAFAVAAHLEPEILVIDEVLAVGDAEFQKKCLGKMEDVSAKEGRTVIFVSHNMGSIQKLCSTGILLKLGKIANFGEIQKVVNGYLNTNENNPSMVDIPFGIQPENEQGYAYRIQIEDLNNQLITDIPIGMSWQVRILFKINKPTNYFIIALSFKTMLDLNIRTAFSERYDLQPGEYQAIFKETCILHGEGRIKLTLGLSSYEKPIHYVEELAYLNFINLNSEIKDPRIIRTSNTAILNPMEISIINCK